MNSRPVLESIACNASVGSFFHEEQARSGRGHDRAFLQSGAWPDGTLFLLEVRESLSVANAASGTNGYFQGEVTGIEAEVKDTKRFAGKWAFFNLGKGTAGAQIPVTASCYSCHATNAAVENTFVQFYPELREVASAKGTLRKVPDQF